MKGKELVSVNENLDKDNENEWQKSTSNWLIGNQVIWLMSFSYDPIERF